MNKKAPTLDTRPARAPQSAERPTTTERGYGARWQRTRLQKLALTPMCEACLTERGEYTAANEVDHKDGKGPNGPRGHDLDNLRSLCKSCHSRKTVREDGGLGHHKRRS